LLNTSIRGTENFQASIRSIILKLPPIGEIQYDALQTTKIYILDRF